MKTELRVYKTVDKLRYEFRDLAIRTSGMGLPVKIIPNREIIIMGAIRIIFIVANQSNIRGWRPDNLVLDEMLPDETKDYLLLCKKK